MPLEIRELVIRINVEESSNTNSNQSFDGNQQEVTETDINMIVEKVLNILREKTER